MVFRASTTLPGKSREIKSYRYRETDLGPYVVVVERKDSENGLGKLTDMKLGNIRISKYNMNTIDIQKRVQNREAITLNSYQDASSEAKILEARDSSGDLRIIMRCSTLRPHQS